MGMSLASRPASSFTRTAAAPEVKPDYLYMAGADNYPPEQLQARKVKQHPRRVIFTEAAKNRLRAGEKLVDVAKDLGCTGTYLGVLARRAGINRAGSIPAPQVVKKCVRCGKPTGRRPNADACDECKVIVWKQKHSARERSRYAAGKGKAARA